MVIVKSAGSIGEEIEMNKEIFQFIIRKAFEAGEDWGRAYSGWFSPREEDTEEKINLATKKIKSALKRKGVIVIE